MNDGEGDAAPPGQAHHNLLSGTAHGPVVQARDIQELHVHAGAPALPVPRQLPPAPALFVDREAAVRRLDGLLGTPRPVNAARVAVIVGGHGVGKSATGRHWAHANSARFADGQLYADFGARRYRGGADVGDVIAGFLRALGIGDAVIPPGLAERTALLRSRLAGKRYLLLLDDVEYAAQVTPLIPASADCLVLVTSRAPIEEMALDDAEVVDLPPLDEPSAEELLTKMIGPDRVSAEPAAVAALAGLCGGLPIALRICGAQLAGPRTDKKVSWLVDRLADESRRLRRLSLGGGHSLQAVFDEACRALAPDAARLYRALGLHPGPSFTPAAAAAAIGSPLDEGVDSLDALVAARLVEDVGERFRLHDLLRTHARQTAEREDPPAHREDTLRAVVGYYAAAAQRMDHALMPDRLRMVAPPPAPPSAPLPKLRSPAEALAWFEGERANLVSALRAAHDREWDVLAWQLGEAMWIAYNNHQDFDEAAEVYALAAESASRTGDRDVEARMRQQVARAEIDLGRFDAAERELRRAETLAERSSNRRLRASIVEFVGLLRLNRGEHEAAAAALRRALAMFEELGYTRGVVLQEYLLGRALAQMGRHQEAVLHLRRAEELVDPVGDALTHGRVLVHLGQAQAALGDRSAAAEKLGQAAALMRRNRVPHYAAIAHEALADLHREVGDPASESAELRAALELYETLGSPRSRVVSRRLAGLAG